MFCDAADPIDAAVIGVLGVLSIDAHRVLRRQIRDSWLHSAASQLPARFVMRGIGAAKATLAEARSKRDFVFVNARADLGRSAGPLTSLMLWWSCALRVWPRAELIGKADDDVFVVLPSVADHLRGASLGLSESVRSHSEHPPLLLWGFLEAYHWDDARHLPAGFSREPFVSRQGSRNLLGPSACERRSSGLCGYELCNRSAQGAARALHGPFSFPKGPLYFVSAQLVSQLNRSAWHRASADATLRSAAATSRTKQGGMLPWEDVFTGYSLARVAQGSPRQRLAAVHIGPELYADGWGFRMRASTLIWHMRTPRPARIGAAHRWASRHHCNPVSVRAPAMNCDHSYEVNGKSYHAGHRYHSCSGAEWRWCKTDPRVYNASGCDSTRWVDLKRWVEK